MALPRSARLRDGRDVQAVSRHGARARAGDLVASARRRPRPIPPLTGATPASSQPARAVVVVGKRAGGAVERNRLRRRLQHVLAPVVATLPPGSDVVVRSGPETASLSSHELSAAVRSCVRRAVERAGLRADELTAGHAGDGTRS